MKKRSIFIPCLILIVGLAVLLYPTAANYMNTRIMQGEIQAFETGLDTRQQAGTMGSWIESVLSMAEANAREPLSILVSDTGETETRQDNRSGQISESSGMTSGMTAVVSSFPDATAAAVSDQNLQSPSPVSENTPVAVIEPSEGNRAIETEASSSPTVYPQMDNAAEGATPDEGHYVFTSGENSVQGESDHRSPKTYAEDEPALAPAFSAPVTDVAITPAPGEMTVANTSENSGFASDTITARPSLNTDGPSLRQSTDDGNETYIPVELSRTLQGIIAQYYANLIDEEQLRRRIEIEVLRFCILESISIAEMNRAKYASFLNEAEDILFELDNDQGFDTEEMFIRFEKAALINGNRYDTNMAYGTAFTENDMTSVWSNVVNRVRMWRVCLFGTGSVLKELLVDIQRYNEALYVTGQADLKDPFSYSQLSFDLSAYGLSHNIIGYLTIPKMNIELPIYLGANKENMAKGAAHLTQTSIPVGGNNTNAVIAAHRGMSTAAMFRNIEKLQVGDAVYITNYWDKLTYRVCEIAIINPSDVESVLIQEDRDLVTLLTCHPYRRNYKRYVVYCEREDLTALPIEENQDSSSEDSISGQGDLGEYD